MGVLARGRKLYSARPDKDQHSQMYVFRICVTYAISLSDVQSAFILELGDVSSQPRIRSWWCHT